MITDICIRELQAIANSSTTFTARENLNAISNLHIYISDKCLLLTWISISEVLSIGTHIILRCCLYFIQGIHLGGGLLNTARNWTSRNVTFRGGGGKTVICVCMGGGLSFHLGFILFTLASREKIEAKAERYLALFPFRPSPLWKTMQYALHLENANYF